MKFLLGRAKWAIPRRLSRGGPPPPPWWPPPRRRRRRRRRGSPSGRSARRRTRRAWSGMLSSVQWSILPHIGCLRLGGFSGESEQFLGKGRFPLLGFTTFCLFARNTKLGTRMITSTTMSLRLLALSTPSIKFPYDLRPKLRKTGHTHTTSCSTPVGHLPLQSLLQHRG